MSSLKRNSTNKECSMSVIWDSWVNICQQEQICSAARKPKKFNFDVTQVWTALLTMLASSSSLFLTCGGKKGFLAVGDYF